MFLILHVICLLISPRKRICPARAAQRWERYREKAAEPFGPSHQEEGSTDYEADSIQPTKPADDAEPVEDAETAENAQSADNVESTDDTKPADDEPAVHYYFVPRRRQHDPNPSETFTSQETLRLYHGLSHGTCVIAPLNEPAFCKVTFIPFSKMNRTELLGWEKLVCFFLNQTQYVEPVKNNGPHMGGVMWAGGWRKCSKRGEAFGRYCSVARLVTMIKRCQYNAEDEAAAFEEANAWIATHLQEMAPGVFDKYRKVLLENNLPSLAQVEYPTPYSALDFASFFTFTMYNFFNQDHMDKDANTWTLVCWIPIFNPQNSSEDDPILADDGFDMIGGQFTFRDFQVYLDLNQVLGVTLCVFRSKDHTHQTLDGVSPSDKYTRIGFSCQMSEKMSNAVVAYINTKTAAKQRVSGQTVQIAEAEAKISKKK